LLFRMSTCASHALTNEPFSEEMPMVEEESIIDFGELFVSRALDLVTLFIEYVHPLKTAPLIFMTDP